MEAGWKATAAVVFALGVGACGGEEAEPETEPQAAPPPAAAPATAQAPDTTADALWSHLQGQAYRESWALWPGTTELYQGSEPHGMLLTTYVNETALAGLRGGGAASLAPGSVIVKENYMPDSTFAAATVMVKVTGYNPEHADWLFAKYDPQGVAEEFGRPPGCQSCHQGAGASYLFTRITP